MILSDNMKKVRHYNDSEFITWLMYLREDMIPKWEKKILNDMILDRCDKMNLEFMWGCCGTNVINVREIQ